MPKKILLVDDDPSIHAGLLRLFRSLGHEVVAVGSEAAAVAALAAVRFDLCVVDLELGDGRGAAVVRAARAARPPAAVLALVPLQGTVADAVEALRDGAADVLAKPFHISAAEETLGRLLGGDAARAGRGRATPGVAVIGQHPAMRLVI